MIRRDCNAPPRLICLFFEVAAWRGGAAGVAWRESETQLFAAISSLGLPACRYRDSYISFFSSDISAFSSRAGLTSQERLAESERGS